MGYEFEIEKIVEAIRRKPAKKILLQAPNGLKPYLVKIAEYLEKETGATPHISAEPCYGACDLAVNEAKMLNAELIVHIGHSSMKIESPVDVMYVDAQSDVDISEAIEKSISQLEKFKKIGIVTTIQHVGKLEDAKRILEKAGKTAIIGPAAGLAKYDGQLVGCDYSTAEKIKEKVEAFLYVGGGLFHPLGAVLATGKPVIAADPYSNKAYDITETGNKILKQRKAAVAKLVEAKKIGIILGLKPGQKRVEAAEGLYRKLKATGKSAVLLNASEITPEALNNFPEVEVFVNTACPRIGIDDRNRYVKPIVTLKEAEMLTQNLKGRKK